MSATNKTMNDFKDNIINKIKSGEIDMKPHWHFVLKTVLLITGIVMTALLATYVLSFIFFSLHRSGLIFAPGYGLRGVGIFVIASPWFLILLAIIFLTTLYILVKKYSFSYKRPLLYSMLGILFLVSFVSFALERTELHDRIQVFTERHNIPAAAPFYRAAIDEISENILLGTVNDVKPNELEIISSTNKPHTVLIDSNTRQKPGSTYSIGERLLIFGENEHGEEDEENENEENTMRAFGIKKVDENFRKRLHAEDQEGQIMRPFQQNRGFPPEDSDDSDDDD